MEKVMQAIDARSKGTQNLNILEQQLYNLGLMTGEAAPLKRAFLGFALGYAAMELAKPSFAYSRDGRARPWTVTSGKTPDSTAVPWFIVPFGAAVFLGLFI